MRILIIGLEDKNKIVDIMIKTSNENLEFFYSDNIKTAFNDMNYYDIDIFVVDTKTNFTSLKKFTSEVDYYMDNYVKGVFISDTEDFKTLVLAMNLGFIDGYIVRHYEEKDFFEMWERYYKNKK